MFHDAASRRMFSVGFVPNHGAPLREDGGRPPGISSWCPYVVPLPADAAPALEGAEAAAG